MSVAKNIPRNAHKTFDEGYIDGYQSLRPDAVPTIPSFSKTPIGLTAYQWGFIIGEDDARA
ncbi:hypothetical protein C7476_109194 [Phyllobacterium bourgognense]|uniref:Uncharacterized protein n=1 Tax=Phyllobacterium bourgognense TaxID=314236 RepID=A0A368YP52_9HYPH|nr:hypothetical protein C7476_109194 [Phyllobacterium bourgognense]